MTQAGGLEMETTATSQVMGRLAGASEQMVRGWGATRAELDGLVSRLGQGPLGATFLEGYLPLATETATIADRCCHTPGRFADVGDRCVAGYEAVEDDIRRRFDAIGTAAPPASPPA